MRVALKIFVVAQKTNGRRHTTRQGMMEKGREWRMQQPSDPQGLVSRPLVCILHFAWNSLVPPIPRIHQSSHQQNCTSTSNTIHTAPHFRRQNNHWRGRPQQQESKNKKKMSKSPQDSDIYAQLAARDTQPEPLKKVLAREQANYDCLSCRVMGMHFLNLQALIFSSSSATFLFC